MTQTPQFGTIVHHDYLSSDPAASTKFYGKLFGWKFESYDPSYTLFEVPGGAGGGFRKPEAGENAGTFNYLLVEDLDAKVKEAAANGAQVLVARQEVPNMGWLAIFVAPGGIVQGLWQAAPGSM